MQNRLGSLVTKDARRTWEAAVIVSLYQKNMCPPNDDEQANIKKINVSVILEDPYGTITHKLLSPRGSVGQ